MSEGAISDSVRVDRSDNHVVEFDPVDGGSVTTQVASAVANATDRDVTALPPMGERVDCDAIEQLFESHDGETELSVSFEFEECQVFLSSIGRIVVTPGSGKPGT